MTPTFVTDIVGCLSFTFYGSLFTVLNDGHCGTIPNPEIKRLPALWRERNLKFYKFSFIRSFLSCFLLSSETDGEFYLIFPDFFPKPVAKNSRLPSPVVKLFLISSWSLISNFPSLEIFYCVRCFDTARCSVCLYFVARVSVRSNSYNWAWAELATRVHPKVCNHGEGPFQGLLLVESSYYRFHI